MYDDYVDYQYDNVTESQKNLLTTQESLSSTSIATPQSITTEVQTTTSTQTNVIHTPSPTSAKKKNPQIPPSPSSSGFTFFGVPLPSLNFNLWGNSRKAQRKDDNETNGRPGRGRYRVFPPTEPEIHRGGFRPLPQGQGGFVPIPDPRLSYERKVKNETDKIFNRTATVTRVFQMPGKRQSGKGQEVRKTFQGVGGGKFGGKEREELTTAKNDAAAVSSAQTAQRVPVKESVYEVSESQVEEQLEMEEEKEEQGGSEEGVDGDGKIWTTVRTMANSGEEVKVEEKIKDVSKVKKVGVWEVEARLPPGKHISAEEEEEEEEGFSTTEYSVDSAEVVTLGMDNSVEKSEFGSATSQTQVLEASALSALLVPGGQLPATAVTKPPSGRSTITKVASPHLSLTADRKLEEEEVDKSQKFVEESGRKEEEEEVEKKVKIMEENPFNWYFQNYNESNIEPYVGVAYSGQEERQTRRWIMVAVVVVVVVQVYF